MDSVRVKQLFFQKLTAYLVPLLDHKCIFSQKEAILLFVVISMSDRSTAATKRVAVHVHVWLMNMVCGLGSCNAGMLLIDSVHMHDYRWIHYQTLSTLH
jgi:hypothetical protein